MSNEKVNDTRMALSAASEALGVIAHALAGRRLLARGVSNAFIRAKMQADALTDEQIEKMASDAFEAAVMHLASIGYPGCSVFSCNPTDEP